MLKPLPLFHYALSLPTFPSRRQGGTPDLAILADNRGTAYAVIQNRVFRSCLISCHDTEPCARPCCVLISMVYVHGSALNCYTIQKGKTTVITHDESGFTEIRFKRNNLLQNYCNYSRISSILGSFKLPARRCHFKLHPPEMPNKCFN